MPEKLKKIISEVGIQRLIILLLVGVFLIVISIPTNKSKSNSNKNSLSNVANEVSVNNDNTNDYVKNLENKLKQTLKKVKNVGEVEVMITLKSSKESIINKDSQSDESNSLEKDSEGGTRDSSTKKIEEQTVLMDDNTPIILKEIEPEINGVIVIAEGGDDINVIKDITDAVEVLFSISVNKIKVMKMK